MKPFVVYIDANTDKITLSKEDFEKYLKEAYERGHEDGYNKGFTSGNSYLNWQNSLPVATDKIRYGTVSPSKPDPITITCNNNNRNSIIKSGHVGD